MADAIGYLAAAIFPLSYLCKSPLRLVLIQLAGAVTWIAYGVAIHSRPVIGANIIVASASSFSAWRFARKAAAVREA